MAPVTSAAWRAGLAGSLAVLVTACVTESPAPLLPDAPVFEATVARPGSNNVLSAMVTVRVRNADSVAVRYHTADAAANESMTPVVRAIGDSVLIPVLGLLPARSYALRAVAYGRGGTVVGDEVEVTTGELPLDLPQYRASGVDPSPGYVVFAAGRFGIVIDNTGRVVWYRHFGEYGPGLNFMAQPNGHYVARPQTPDPSDSEPWVEIDPMGNLTRTLGCALGLPSRPHDLISENGGGYWLMCDDTRTVDLTSHGGRAGARVTGTNVQYIGSDGTLRFQWSPFDHFAVADLPSSELSGAAVNWTHGNSIDIDGDGNIIVSFRNLGEITKINTISGAVMWRLGGKQNQFAFSDSPSPAFSRQHGARMRSSGQLILLDNTGDPNESRSERYFLDENSRTARLIQSYGSVPGVVTQIGGSVQSLSGSRTLVSFGTEGRVEEYDAIGRVMWRIEGNPGYVFRAQRIRSLYAPGVGDPR